MKSPAPSSLEGHELAALAGAAHELVALEGQLVRLEREMKRDIRRVPEERRDSARNLVHYIALRQHDLRDLQLSLAKLGLSSLGRSEGCVRESVLQVSRRAHEALALAGSADARDELARLRNGHGPALTWQAAKDYLHRHTREMLGPRPDDRHIYVMVTAPSAKEADGDWMARMLRAGMNVLRINCAHEGPEQWGAIVRALHDARSKVGSDCRILMDLAGPKIRTGPVGGERRIATWKPAKDELGGVTAAARVVIRAADANEHEPVAQLRLDAGALASLRRGDELRFDDARGKKRALVVHEAAEGYVVALADRRAYVMDHVRARVRRRGARDERGERGETLTLRVAAGEGAAIDVRVGDELVLSGRGAPGRAPRRSASGAVLSPGVVACTLPAALDHLEIGHRVLFDDGRIETVVVQKGKRHSFRLKVARTQKVIAKLKAEKGINLPDTATTIDALTDEDKKALAFVAEHADAVSLSFVKRPDDVRALHTELDRLGRPGIGVVLKIETRAGFENLPRLLLEGLRRPPLSVMIARGDLAVEVGFERLAELQEEILWLCEACHVPAIWATQVLDTLARTGVPSRAEVTDAAASVAAECVMLNKGPFVEDAVRVLADILRRMEKHRYKKRSLFRKLRVSTFTSR